MTEGQPRIIALCFFLSTYFQVCLLYPLNLTYAAIYITLHIFPSETAKSGKSAANQVLYNGANFAALFVYVPIILEALCS